MTGDKRILSPTKAFVAANPAVVTAAAALLVMVTSLDGKLQRPVAMFPTGLGLRA